MTRFRRRAALVLFGAAALISATGGSALAAGGQITGTVTALGGAPLPGTSVGLDTASASAVADADGHYTIDGVDPGNHKVYFVPNQHYFPQNYGGEPAAVPGRPPDYFGFSPVAVTAGASTAGIDVSLTDSAVITGTVTDGQGHPLAGIAVNVADGGTGPMFDGPPTGVQTDAAGHYVIGRLPFNAYLWFFGAGYVGRFYGDGQDYRAATPIQGGRDVDGIDVQMTPAGAIAGRVTDDNGRPLAASVTAYRPDGTVAGEAAATDGSYVLGRLPTGSYLVSFLPNSTPSWIYLYLPGAPLYDPAAPMPSLARWYGNTPQGHAAVPVAVTAGSTTAGVDGQLFLSGPPSATRQVPSSAGPNPPAATAPSAASPARVPATISVSRGGTVMIRVRCAGPTACAGTASLSVGAGQPTAVANRGSLRRMTIGMGRFRLAPTKAALVAVRLTADGRTLLRHNRGRVTARLTIAATGAASAATGVAQLRSPT